MASTLTNANVNGGVAVTLGKVTGAQSSLSQNFVIAPLVNNTSTATIVTSTSGALRNIKVTGVITAASFALLNTAKNAIEEFVDGSQLATTTLVIDAEGTEIYNGSGILQDFTWKYGVDTRAIMDYSLTFVEGTVGGAT